MKKRILCYGDSNTWGYIGGSGERFPEGVRWTSVLENELGNEYTVIEDGINGRTTCFDKGWGDCKNGRTGLGYALLPSAPLDAIVIMLGTNDLAEKNASYAACGVDELIRIIQVSNEYFRVESPIFPNGVKILLIAPPHLGKGIVNSPVISFKDKYEEGLKFKELFKEVAERRNTFFLDAGEITETCDADYLHLTAESHIALGKAVKDKIIEMFK